MGASIVTGTATNAERGLPCDPSDIIARSGSVTQQWKEKALDEAVCYDSGTLMHIHCGLTGNSLWIDWQRTAQRAMLQTLNHPGQAGSIIIFLIIALRLHFMIACCHGMRVLTAGSLTPYLFHANCVMF